MPSRRHTARIAVMQTLFELETRPDIDPHDVLGRNIKEMESEHPVDVALAEKLMEGVFEKNAAVCTAIQRCAPQWPLDRMDRISRSILMVGGFELLFGNDAPPPVVMNEAIEIAKEFGTEESAKFVNGVLNALAHGGPKEN